MEDKELVSSNGYLVIRDMFAKDEIGVLQDKFDATEFNPKRIHQYEQWTGHHPEDVLDILRKPKFLERIEFLSGKRLMWAQLQAFRLFSGKEAHRLNWHFGRASFLYLLPEFAGWTLWIPLTPIDPTDQRGGLAFISRKLANGSCEAHLMSAMASRDDLESIGKHFGKLSQKFINNPILDIMCEEPSFKVGDAVLFHKFTYHTSIVLESGPLKQRNAIALRFVDENGLLNKIAAERLGPYLLNKDMSSILSKYEHGTPLRDIKKMFRTLYS